MKIIIFGLGSIGKKQTKLLLEMYKHKLFVFRSNRESTPNKLGIEEVYSWRDVEDLSPDVAFITNPTYLHIKTAIKCVKLGMDLFLEKPIGADAKGLKTLLGIVRKKKLTTYVAYCMRFHPVIEDLKQCLYTHKESKNFMHCNILASSYLPEWRPSRDYETIYSAQSQKGGGVILDLSHEIDYAQHLFGEILDIQGTFGKISKLKITAEDYADILMKCEKAVVNLHMNFFSKNKKRNLRIDFANHSYIEADLLKNTIVENRKGKVKRRKYDLKQDHMYRQQLKYFFENIENKKMTNNIFDASTLYKKILKFKRI